MTELEADARSSIRSCGDAYARPERLRVPDSVLISPLTVNSWSRLQPVVIQTQHTPHYCSSKSRPITRKMAVISHTLHPNKPTPPHHCRGCANLCYTTDCSDRWVSLSPFMSEVKSARETAGTSLARFLACHTCATDHSP
jgi:hypothetical protein